MKKKQFTQYIKDFDFLGLFNELGWDNFSNQLPIAVNEDAFMLKGVAVKKGFVILQCPPLSEGKIPLSNIRKQIEGKVAKHYYEHLIIYTDNNLTNQVWQLAIKEENKPKQVREVSWYSHQDADALFQRMKNLLFTLDEEETITIVDVKQRITENFAKNSEQVTKKFYTEFKKQHTAFLDFIEGIDDHITNKENQNKQWYASLMLNRLMFCYFIQKKGFLDQDFNYLQNKLKACTELSGKGNFYSFYRTFLLELFHDGLGKPATKRSNDLPVELGKIPYLNGGLFDVHELEHQFSQIQIEDDAFKKIFCFFDQWNWHLDNSIEATGRDINPDVIGYVFEKYINDRAAMGAYYTKEDITDYIGKNTIIPFLFDETQRQYKDAFKPDGELWTTLKNSGSIYIYDAVKHGVPDTDDVFSDLPDDVKAGLNHQLENKTVERNTKPHLWEIRQPWNQKAPENIGLPTEIYRELIERRKRYAELIGKIENGDITQINDFITYNLNIRQFTQDFIENTTDAKFIHQFYKAITKVTILDPTCGSGAFLFAALNILEPLYEACINRMEQFAEEQPGKHKFFEEVLAEINGDNHPNLQYYIFKSIILNNLYGVDIMREAVEIAKLRLFLKLVATVDVNSRKDNFGLEPLPDIDFNIRAGNTLIGFATEKELLETIKKTDALFAQDKLDEFKEEFELVSKAYAHFQNSQLINDQGSDSFKRAKAQLANKLNQLNEKLNTYLAGNYGITDKNKQIEIEITGENKKKAKKKVNQYNHWLQTHQPFHWFAEFYQIIAGNGGFDCIIGNPPYVNLSEQSYTLLSYLTIPCGDIYAMILERCSTQLLNMDSKFSMIVPISLVSTDGYSSIRKVLNKSQKSYLFANFGVRPAKLFDGVDKRLTIFVSLSNSEKPKYFTTKYHRWKGEERSKIFEKFSFVQNNIDRFNISGWTKTSSSIENSILNHLSDKRQTVAHFLLRSGENRLSFTRKLQYFIQFFKESPRIFNEKEELIQPSELKHLYLNSDAELFALNCLLNSNLFFWFFISFSDCRNVNYREIKFFPIDLKEFAKLPSLEDISKALWHNLTEESVFLLRNDKKAGLLRIESFQPRKSKPIIDQIDTVLAVHYGFTEAELDFIINYDIKYRMGKALFGEEENEEEEED